jgi:hypothetical protein
MAVRPFKRRRWLAIIACALTVLLYLGSYIAMSARGEWIYSQTGKYRYSFGWAMSDVIRWDPAAAHWEPFRDIYGKDVSRGTPLGYLYSPLIRLDRRFIHPDKPALPGMG